MVYKPASYLQEKVLEHPNYLNSSQQAQPKQLMTSDNQPFGLDLGWVWVDCVKLLMVLCEDEVIDGLGSLGVLGKPAIHSIIFGRVSVV